MSRFVVRLPDSLTEKVREAAEEAEMLPTEYIREILRAKLS